MSVSWMREKEDSDHYFWLEEVPPKTPLPPYVTPTPPQAPSPGYTPIIPPYVTPTPPQAAPSLGHNPPYTPIVPPKTAPSPGHNNHHPNHPYTPIVPSGTPRSSPSPYVPTPISQPPYHTPTPPQAPSPAHNNHHLILHMFHHQLLKLLRLLPTTTITQTFQKYHHHPNPPNAVQYSNKEAAAIACKEAIPVDRDSTYCRLCIEASRIHHRGLVFSGRPWFPSLSHAASHEPPHLKLTGPS
ncbi:hypothetical protein HN51_050114 [Arachis hypogaea]